MLLTDSVETLSGVGQAKLKMLNKLGIYTIHGLITHYPRDYMDRSVITGISGISAGQTVTVRAKVTKTELLSTTTGMILLKVFVSDGEGSLTGVWFNQPYLKNVFLVGDEFMFSGVVSMGLNGLQMDKPDYEAISGKKELLKSGRITPVYPSTGKLAQDSFRQLIKKVLSNDIITESLPGYIIKKYNLCSRRDAINNIHFPGSAEMFLEARKRLVFEELLIMQLCLFHAKGHFEENKGFVFSNIAKTEIESLFPFALTEGQKNALGDIINDFRSGKAMNRLVQGDVGSGKTVVAQIACYIAVKNGYQAAVMAPTEVLATQHYYSFSIYFSKLGYKVELLSGSVSKKKKNELKEKLKNGEINVIIGTHALIQEDVVFERLGIAITDEQHRFGVRQRAKLSGKSAGLMPHVLVMTATPIPRTLALILYGDLDISSITGLPPGRQEINTSFVSPSYHERIYAFIKKQVSEGRQAYIICAAIEQGEALDIKPVLEYTETLKSGALNGINISCLHGKMKPAQKQEIMERFASGGIDVLVSTTVIEVGINVPNATVILIENSDRFGLSQLHQLRGRVGRGSEKSYCILVSDTKSKTTRQRLKAMVSTNDGFAISEMDLELRGPGEFFGTKQHGLPEMKIANLYRDINILKTAQDVALELYKEYNYLEDEKLMQEININLRQSEKFDL